MKKFILLFIASAMIVTSAVNNSHAAAIGIKGGYCWTENDLNDLADNTWNIGIYFDMGSVLFSSLDFRPGLDYFRWKKNGINNGKDWGVHFDWYWNFMGKQAISPFIGFGPTLTYMDMPSNQHNESHAGLDLFAGADIKIGSTPLSVLLEARYKFPDIAYLGRGAFLLDAGISYHF